MKSKNVAFGLNFLLPGAGFGYLGLWKYAAFNLLGALAVGVVLSLLLPEWFLGSYGRYIAIGIGSASGSLALAAAEAVNAKAAKVPTMEELSDETKLP